MQDYEEKKILFYSNLISYFFLFISFLFLIYVFFRSEIVNDGLKFNFYVKYYFLAFSLIVGSLSTFFLKRKLKLKVFTLFIWFFCFLYLFEISIILYKEHISEKIYQTKIKDSRTKYQVYQDFKNNSVNTVTVIYPSLFIDKKNNDDELFPLSGISKIKTIFCNESGYWSMYESDRYGFNNPDFVWDESTFDFVITGDSFAQGACVKSGYTIADQLRKKNKAKVLNLGMSGNGPLIEFAALKEYLNKKKVKRVLWLYYEGNDLLNLKNEISNKILKKYLKSDFSQNLMTKQSQIDQDLFNFFNSILEKQKSEKEDEKQPLKTSYILAKAHSVAKLFHLRKFLGDLLKINLIDINPGYYEMTLANEFSEILSKSRDYVENKNAKFYFVYIPTHTRFDVREWNTDNYKNYKSVINIVKNLNIPVIDINEKVFKIHDDPLSLFPFKRNGHYTNEGYRLVAEKILEQVQLIENKSN